MFIPILISTLMVAICSAAPVQILYSAPPLVGYQSTVIQPFIAGPRQALLVYPGYQYLRQNQGGINNTQFNEIAGIFQGAASQAQGSLGQLQEWGQSWGQSWGQDWGGYLPGSGNEKLPASTIELKPIEFKPLAEPLEMDLEMKTKLAQPDAKQFFTVAGYPQFFGNYGVLPSPAYNPILSFQPVQQIRARSLADPSSIKNDKFLAQVAPAAEDVPLTPAGTVLLAEPLKSILMPDAPIAAEPAEVPAEPETFAKVLQEIAVVPDEKLELKSRSNVESSEFNAVKADAVKEIAAESIAQAAPQAAAIVGKGGMAEAAPVATAIVGKDGLAIAQPIASAVAGEFGGSVKTDHKEEPEASKDKVE